MKIIIDIKDSKAAFFLELLQNFEDFITIESSEKEVLSNSHKAILDERLASYKNDPTNLLDWEDVQKEIEQNL